MKLELTNAVWLQAHIDDYNDARNDPNASPDYVACQLEELQDLAVELIGETV